MAIDLNALPLELGDAPQIDWDNYADPAESGFAPLPEGDYNFKTTSAEPDYKSIEELLAQVQKDGFVKVLYDHTAYDQNTGQEVGTLRFDRVSSKIFKRGKQQIPVSFAADQLRAVGITDRPQGNRQMLELLLSVKSYCEQGNYWQGSVQWDGYCSHKGTAVETVMENGKPALKQPEGHKLPFAPRGMKKWPLLHAQVNGTPAEHNHVMKCPDCGQDVTARARITRRIPKS